MEPAARHVQVRRCIEKASAWSSTKNVLVILRDSITRLARASNRKPWFRPRQG